jgi:hypothetical protein
MRDIDLDTLGIGYGRIAALVADDRTLADDIVESLGDIRRMPTMLRAGAVRAYARALADRGVVTDPDGMIAIVGSSGKEWATFLAWYAGRKTHADREWAPYRQDQTLAIRPQVFEHVDDAPGARIGAPGTQREVVRIAHEKAAARKANAAPRRTTHEQNRARKESRRVESASGRMVRGVWVMK